MARDFYFPWTAEPSEDAMVRDSRTFAVTQCPDPEQRWRIRDAVNATANLSDRDLALCAARPEILQRALEAVRLRQEQVARIKGVLLKYPNEAGRITQTDVERTLDAAAAGLEANDGA